MTKDREPALPQRSTGTELKLDEEDRQLLLMALAHLSLERPGWDDALNRIAVRIDRVEDGRAVLYDELRQVVLRIVADVLAR